MSGDWADEKAEALRYTLARQPDTRHQMLTSSALREACERGRQEERWACYRAAFSAIPGHYAGECAASAIAARGLTKPEEE